jgi:predicted pyridoxine 5'-phosphate oxidase superfamily flavin-nucleotide-binding protein
MDEDETALPGSAGEHELQVRFGTEQRARDFYKRQMLDRLNQRMQDFVKRQRMLFLATADRRGECDCGIRTGDPGFVYVLDERTLLIPDYRGNGVFSSLGNISENAHIGLLFVDFEETTIGLHVNGAARLVENDELLASPGLPAELPDAASARGGRRPLRWIRVDVAEAYIQCSKHIPAMRREDGALAWGTDNCRIKGGDFFQARRESRPWYPASGEE